MIRTIVSAGLFALTSGYAFAGGGCINGDHAALEKNQLPPVAAAVGDNMTDPAYLAWLKDQESTESLEKLIETPAVHN